MNNRYKVIVICGKSGAGKDFYTRMLRKKYRNDFYFPTPWTTRPQRKNEKWGREYCFVTKSRFKQETFLDETKFNNWHYGTPIEYLWKSKPNIIIGNPKGIQQMLKYSSIDFTVIEIYADDTIRLARQLKRQGEEDILEIQRRLKADDEDFKELHDWLSTNDRIWYKRIYNNDITKSERTLKELYDYITFWTDYNK